MPLPISHIAPNSARPGRRLDPPAVAVRLQRPLGFPVAAAVRHVPRADDTVVTAMHRSQPRLAYERDIL